MNAEEALIQYLYDRLVRAMQAWQRYDDIYGIWFAVDSDRTNLTRVSCLRLSP
jgi:hypothetical protein